MKRFMVFLLFFVMIGATPIWADVTNSGATTNTQTNASGSNTTISGGFQKFGIGISGGTYRTDENCERIKLSKVLNDLGMKVAAVSILCQDERVFHAMIQSGTPCPYNGKIWNEALKDWKKYDKLRPDYEQYTADLKYIEKKNKKLQKEYEKKMVENAEELTKQQIELDAVAAEKQKLIDEMNKLKGVKKEKNNSPK